jgi:murein DD-endopeptidase MepM/ murein hydrolase activator NlpD
VNQTSRNPSLGHRTTVWRAVVAMTGLLLFSGVLSGCGNLEWPPPGYGRQSGDAAPPVTINNAAFVNASAVTVGPGDTVYALSRRHQVSERDIIIANNLKAPYRLTVGQRIVLPRGKEHTVVKDDNLFKISLTYNVDMYDLARANAIKPPYTIYVDQKLRLPGTSGTGTMVATAQPKPTTTTTATTTQTTTETSNQTKTVAAALQTKTTSKTNTAVPSPPASTGKGFVWPIRGRVISNFGAKDKGLHNDGINIAAPKGSPIQAAENGVVAYAGNELRGFGNLLLIKHADGYVSAYAHNAKLLVKRGDKIRKGQTIATVGSTGNVTSPQLHFELRKGKKALDPKTVMPPLSA